MEEVVGLIMDNGINYVNFGRSISLLEKKMEQEDRDSLLGRIIRKVL